MMDDVAKFNQQMGADRVKALLGGKDKPGIDADFDALERGDWNREEQSGNDPTGKPKIEPIDKAHPLNKG